MEGRSPFALASAAVAAGRPRGGYVLVAVPQLLERRLIFVAGKGGVGKSTVATALGLLAARRGLRTIVAELSSQERVRQAFATSGATFEEVALADDFVTFLTLPAYDRLD